MLSKLDKQSCDPLFLLSIFGKQSLIIFFIIYDCSNSNPHFCCIFLRKLESNSFQKKSKKKKTNNKNKTLNPKILKINNRIFIRRTNNKLMVLTLNNSTKKLRIFNPFNNLRTLLFATGTVHYIKN